MTNVLTILRAQPIHIFAHGSLPPGVHGSRRLSPSAINDTRGQRLLWDRHFQENQTAGFFQSRKANPRIAAAWASVLGTT